MRRIAIAIISAFLVCGCLSGEQSFIDGRQLDICNESYWICKVPSGCLLDEDFYIEGNFPGVGRAAIVTDQRNTTIKVRIYLKSMVASGTEFLVRIFEPDCKLDQEEGVEHLLDVDIFDEAGDDRTLSFELETNDDGEHLLEVYSDASAEYLLVVETSND